MRLALTREDDEHQATRLATLAQAPWSPRNHATFPAAARARAVELHRIGHQLAKAVRPGGGEAMAFVDVWMAQIVPHAAAIYRLPRSMAIRPMIRPQCVCLTPYEEW